MCSVVQFFLLGRCYNWSCELDSPLLYYSLRQLVCSCLHLNHYKIVLLHCVLCINIDINTKESFTDDVNSRGFIAEMCLSLYKINTQPTSNFSVDGFVLFKSELFFSQGTYFLAKCLLQLQSSNYIFLSLSLFVFKGNCTFAGKQPPSSWPLWILLQGTRAALHSEVSQLYMSVLWGGCFFL